MSTDRPPNRWVRFWHEPLRAESLALTRILFAAALLLEQLTQYLPQLEWLFGSRGVAPADVAEEVLLPKWRWSVLFFRTDDMRVIGMAFCAWVLATAALLVGWRTRLAAVLTWFGAYCFLNRNYYVLNGGDDVLMIGLFLLMVSPCGGALSVDCWRQRRSAATEASSATARPMWIAPWSLRLFQIQLCVIYVATGLAKTYGEMWWKGTSVHYVLLDPTMTRWSAAQFAVPLWVTAPLTWATLAFELLFPLLVLWKRTRNATLWCGLLFHVGIYLVIEVGWFSFYTMAMYGAWVPPSWWKKRNVRNRRRAPLTAATQTENSALSPERHGVQRGPAARGC